MSVFVETEVDTSCKQCRTRESKPGKNRCEFCDKRYDGNGKAFIIACDIYHFVKGSHAVKVWVCDSRVNQVFSSRESNLNRYIDLPESSLLSVMKTNGFEFEYKTDRVI